MYTNNDVLPSPFMWGIVDGGPTLGKIRRPLFPIRTITGNATLEVFDFQILVKPSPAANVTLTLLPSAFWRDQPGGGWPVIVQDQMLAATNGKTILIAAAAGEFINGLASVTITTDSGAITLRPLSDGTGWTAIGSSAGGGSGAPADADYLVRTANATLTAERVITDTASAVWDWSVAGQAKVNVQFGTSATTAAVGNDSRITGAMQKSQNLFDLTGPLATARSNLGVPTGTSGAVLAFLNTSNQWSGQNSFPLATLTDGASVAWDVVGRQKAQVTFAGNRTMSAVTNLVEGTTYWLWCIQDATGSRVPSWTTSGAGSFSFGAAGAPTLSTAANTADVLTFEAKTVNSVLKMCFLGIVKGFT